MATDSLETLVSTSINRRSLLKRAGLIGLTLPAAGALLNACGGSSANKPNASTIGATSATSASNTQNTAAPAQGVTEITVTAMDLMFMPNEVSAPAGQPVRFTFMNTGAMEHDWNIPDLPVSGLQV